MYTPLNSRIVLSYCGAYNTTNTLGFNTNTQIYSITLILDLLPVITLILTPSHQYESITLCNTTMLHSSYPNATFIQLFITHHLASPCIHTSSLTHILLSLTQLLWSTHLTNTITPTTTHTCIISFVGGLKSNTPSLTLSDISHHHSSLPILLAISLTLTQNTSTFMRKDHSHEPLHHHPHSSIALSPSPLTYNTTASITSQHHSLPSPSTPSHDLTTSSTTYLHHSWIASITTLASSLHLTIYLTRDYTHLSTSPTPLTIILTDKSSVLSSITHASTYIGCHTLSIYTHNDTCISPTTYHTCISLDPMLSLLIQESLGKHL